MTPRLTRLFFNLYFWLLFPVILFASPAVSLCQQTTWTTNGYTLLKNGSPFFAKGVDYSVVPIGEEPQNPPYGDYFTSDKSDFYNRDIPAMRAMGVNCIRLYAGSPANSANYTNFLDALYNNGQDPIYVIMTSFIDAANMLNPTAVSGYVADYGTMAQNLKNHPAVMGFSIGNELNTPGNIGDPDFWTNLDGIAAAVRQNAPAKLTVVAMADDGTTTLSQGMGKLPHVMCWGLNIYRGSDWGGSGDNVFTQYRQYSASDVKPFLITEYGTPSSTRSTPGGTSTDIVLLDNNAQAQGEFLVTMWTGLVADARAADRVTCGGLAFNWVDEWWKAGQPSAHDPGPNNAYQGNKFAGGYWDEEWFGLNGVGAGSPGVLQPRAAVAALQAEWAKTSHDGREIYGNIPTAIPAIYPLIID